MTAFNESLKIIWTGPGSTSLSGTVTRSADTEVSSSVDLTASEADKHITLSVRQAGLKLLYLKASTGMTVRTNGDSLDSPGPADDVISLSAGVPLHFLSEAGMTNPLTVDVADLYVTEEDANAGTLEIRALFDGTP